MAWFSEGIVFNLKDVKLEKNVIIVCTGFAIFLSFSMLHSNKDFNPM